MSNINSVMKEFKAFILKGNIIDMAVGVIIGGAFQKIVSSLVDDIIMPVISLFTGRLDFTNMFIALDGQHYPTLAEAQAHTSTIAYGSFITGLINFLLTAFVIFLVIRWMNKLRAKEEPAPQPKTTKVCPFCKTEIDLHATRCPHCTSQLEAE